MRLVNCQPQSLIGKTIIYRWQFWRVEAVEADGLRLGKDYCPDKGRLALRQLPQCRLYPEPESIDQAYPRLFRALRWACLLTHTEAKCCIHGFLTTGATFMGSEAVAHIGGALAAIRHALRCRHAVRKELRRGNQAAT